ncbi:MAG TPA: DNA polymerase III subunit delta [Armatimonadota bacterium]|jgi:DNA polymerase-3 subunit delta
MNMDNEQIYPVYLLKGKEGVRRGEALSGLIDRLTDAAFRDFDLERIDGRSATAEQVLSAAGAAPFASPRRLTVVEDAQRMAPDAVQKLQKLLSTQIGARSAVVFVAGETGDGEKVQGVMRRLENLAKSMGVVRSFDPLKPAEAAQWLTRAVQSAGHTLEPEARIEMLARVGPNLGVLEREVEKLAVFAGDRKAITRADVVAVTPESAEYSVFALVDAVSEGRVAAAMHVLHGLRAANEPAQRIMPLLARQMRLVWQAKLLSEDRHATGRLPNDPNLLKLPPFLQDKARKQAHRFTWDDLSRALRLLLEKDLALKGIEGPPATDDEALETLVVSLCRPQ